MFKFCYADRMDEPRWLDPDELAAWRWLSAMLLLLPPHLDEALAEHGLTFFDYSILVALSASDGRTCPTSHLASLTQGSLSRLSHATKRLEKRGWVERCRCPDDGRVTLVTLTDEGFARLESAAPDHVASVRRAVFDVLDEEQVEQLRAIGAAVHGAIRDGRPAPWERPSPVA